MADDEHGLFKMNPAPEPEILTKFADVKSRSRVAWTAERQAQLRDMWDRGDKASAIAKALGCEVGAINVARGRFGLPPRRIVPGRPKELPDEPAHTIDRVAFTTSRLMEFCTEKELVAQTGHEAHRWPEVIIKELGDNAIDACEEAGIAPTVKVTIKRGHAQSRRRAAKPTRIVIEDNGPGIPAKIVRSIIDYNVRISSREAYISPTRGRQGNALKTILPMAYVLGGKVMGETLIEACGRKHRIRFSVNQIKQEPIVDLTTTRSKVTTGTRITVFWPVSSENQFDVNDTQELLEKFIWMNPHLTLTFRVDGKTYFEHEATNPEWTKYRPRDATSAHWYTLAQFERYAGALIARDQEAPRTGRKKTTVRDFVAQFRGMSATDKQKQVLRALGAAHMSLYRLFGSETRINHARMEKLLRLLQEHTRPVRPQSLGIIGEDHLRRMLIGADGEPKAVKYLICSGSVGNVPYMIEVAAAPYKQWVAGEFWRQQRRKLVTGVNFSATLENPFESFRNMEGLSGILVDLRAGESAPVIVCVHYACPHIEYLDRGKSRIGLD